MARTLVPLRIGTDGAPTALLHVAQAGATSGAPNPAVRVQGGAHSGITGVETIDVDLALDRTVTFLLAGPIATQRAVVVRPPTYAASGPTQTITTAATVALLGAPSAGANVSIGAAYTVWSADGDVLLQGCHATIEVDDVENGFVVRATTTVTNDFIDVGAYVHRSSGTVAAGFGLASLWGLQNDTGVEIEAGALGWLLTVATTGGESVRALWAIRHAGQFPYLRGSASLDGTGLLVGIDDIAQGALGKLSIKGHDNFTGSSANTDTAAVQTVVAAPVTIYSRTLADLTVRTMRVTVTARRDDGTERAVFTRFALVYREGGGATIQGSVALNPADIKSTGAASSLWDVTLTPSGNDLLVRVDPGTDGNAINWVCTVSWQQVGDDA